MYHRGVDDDPPPPTALAAGAQTFIGAAGAYDRFIGRYAPSLARAFVAAVGLDNVSSALDVGCGPGALTTELAGRLGPSAVTAVDPSSVFVEACRERNPDVRVLPGTAEALPLDDDSFDLALAQLVLHFVSDPEAAAAELRRVVSSGGTVAACVWDFGPGMAILRAYWDAATAVDPAAPNEFRERRFGRDGEIAALFIAAGMTDVRSGSIDASATYADFDEAWDGFLGGAGPAGAHCMSLDGEQRARVRELVREGLGTPVGPFALTARAWYATARVT